MTWKDIKVAIIAILTSSEIDGFVKIVRFSYIEGNI